MRTPRGRLARGQTPRNRDGAYDYVGLAHARPNHILDEMQGIVEASLSDLAACDCQDDTSMHEMITDN